jgi:hypothetical protein
MEADMIRLSMPSVPQKYAPDDERLSYHCRQCYNYIKHSSESFKSPAEEREFYRNMEAHCINCTNAISTQYQNDIVNNRSRYKNYHKGPISKDAIMEWGPKDNYYNNTMHMGAKFWANVADRRRSESIVNALPSVK